VTQSFGAPIPELALPPSQVEDLLQVFLKALRATQLYLPNNPVYQRALENLRAAFRQVWQSSDDLHLDVSEDQLRWEDNVVYKQEQRTESIAWTLFKDGVRSLSFRPGVEDSEIVRFLAVLHKAKNLSADAADDLLTLLWAEDYQFIAYTFRELTSEGAVPIEPGAPLPKVPPTEVRHVVQAEAPPRPEGLVSIEDFDTTLYFLEDKDIEYLRREADREYAQDLRRNVLSMLFDLLELQTYGTVRAELIGIVDSFIPYLLAAGDFPSVAYILREIRVVMQRARELLAEHREVLTNLPARLSQPEALSQLLQSLDEATAHPSEAELAETFNELRPEALPTLVGWIPKLTNERVRDLIASAAAKLAEVNTAEVVKALASGDPATQFEMVRLAGRLKLAGATEALGPLLDSPDTSLRLATVDALIQIANHSALRFVEKAIDDPDRDVRIAAVRFLAGRGHRNAFARVDQAVTAGKLRDADLTEKMCFYEAYGMLAGTKGVPLIEKLLVPRGLLGRKEDAETRACAAMALGKIRAPEARAALEKASQDKEALVRNAVARALREIGT